MDTLAVVCDDNIECAEDSKASKSFFQFEEIEESVHRFAI